MIIPLMLALDVAWWVAGMRLTKKRLARVLFSVFMAAQIAGLLSFIGGRWLHAGWLREMPKAVFAGVIIWHFFGLAVFLPLGIVRVLRVDGSGHGPVGRSCGANLPAATPASGHALTRREFIGAGVALAPPLFTVGLTGVALAQLNHFRVRRFTLSIPALPRALDGITDRARERYPRGQDDVRAGCCARWSTPPTPCGRTWFY